jgi:hypothetical protein
VSRITSKRGPEGVELYFYGDDGRLDVHVTLLRPCFHAALIAHIMNWQDEIREEEGGPRPYVEPLEFRKS